MNTLMMRSPNWDGLRRAELEADRRRFTVRLDDLKKLTFNTGSCSPEQ